jgi:putative membrane protein (TIGR04086 family)
MSTSTRILWLRIVSGGVLVEVALFAVAILLYSVPNGMTALLYTVVPLCLIATFFAGLWVARKAGGRFILHGLLVGVVAALLYEAMSWKVTLPTAYIVGNLLKLVGGAAGGLVAQKMAAGRGADTNHPQVGTT